MKQQATITITAIVEYDDTQITLEDIDASASICFYEEDKYTGEQVFYPKLQSAQVLEYQDVITIKNHVQL